MDLNSFVSLSHNEWHVLNIATANRAVASVSRKGLAVYSAIKWVPIWNLFISKRKASCSEDKIDRRC